MARHLLSRKTSILALAGVLLLSGGVYAAATTNTADTLLGIAKGEGLLYERGLSRGSAALAVHVGEITAYENATDERPEPTPVEGATVTVLRLAPPPGRMGDHPPGDDAPRDPPTGPPNATDIPGNATLVATGTTDAEGKVVFELKRGPYLVAVVYGDSEAHHRYVVAKDMRVGVVFGPEGEAHWFGASHKDLRRHGEAAPVGVRVMQIVEDGRAPLANATVSIYRGDALVTENVTNGRGTAMFYLHAGFYRIEVETPDGNTAEIRIETHGRPLGLAVGFDESGEGHWVVKAPAPHDGPRDDMRRDAPVRDGPQRDGPRDRPQRDAPADESPDA